MGGQGVGFFLQGIPVFQHHALSSYALTYAVPAIPLSEGGKCGLQIAFASPNPQTRAFPSTELFRKIRPPKVGQAMTRGLSHDPAQPSKGIIC